MADESETAFWLSAAGIRESVAESEQDIVAGRTYGEDDIRAELAAADADYAVGNTISGEELRRRYGLPPIDPAAGRHREA